MSDDNVYDHTPCPHGCTERDSHWHRHDAAHGLVGELDHWHVYNPRRVTVVDPADNIQDAIEREQQRRVDAVWDVLHASGGMGSFRCHRLARSILAALDGLDS